MADSHADAHGHTDEGHYWKIWGTLLVLLAISIGGPFLGIQLVTLITAFGIAIVKAYMVAKNFMHLNIERQYVVYLILTMVVFVLLFFAGSSPDVMKWEGDNWVKPKVEQASSHPAEHE
jgi:caa(3)-type oxidase subunit IV